MKWKFLTLGLIRSSPAVAADGTIYVGSFDGNLYAITPEGQIKWSYYAGAPILTSPTLAPHETIFIASGGPKDGTLHAVTFQETVSLKFYWKERSAFHHRPWQTMKRFIRLLILEFCMP